MKWLVIALLALVCTVSLTEAAQTIAITVNKDEARYGHWGIIVELAMKNGHSKEEAERIAGNSSVLNPQVLGLGTSGKVWIKDEVHYKKGKVIWRGVDLEVYIVDKVIRGGKSPRFLQPSAKAIAKAKQVLFEDTEVAKAGAQPEPKKLDRELEWIDQPPIPAPLPPLPEKNVAPTPDVTQVAPPTVMTERDGILMVQAPSSPLSFQVGEIIPKNDVLPITPAPESLSEVSAQVIEAAQTPPEVAALQNADIIMGSMVPPDAPPAPSKAPAVAAASDNKEESGTPSDQDSNDAGKNTPPGEDSGNQGNGIGEDTGEGLPNPESNWWKYVLGVIIIGGILFATKTLRGRKTRYTEEPYLTSTEPPVLKIGEAVRVEKQPAAPVVLDVPPPPPVILPKARVLDEKDIRTVDRTDKLPPKKSDKDHRKDLLVESQKTVASIVDTCENSLREMERELSPFKKALDTATEKEQAVMEQYETAMREVANLEPGSPKRSAKAIEIAQLNEALKRARDARIDAEKKFQPINRSCESLREKLEKEKGRLAGIEAQIARNKAEGNTVAAAA